MPKTLQGKIAKLALDHPEHRAALVRVMRDAGWMPGDLRDPTFDSGHVVPEEPYQDTGSQVPPPRDRDGVPEDAKDAPTRVTEHLATIKKAQEDVIAARAALRQDLHRRLAAEGFIPKGVEITGFDAGRLVMNASGNLLDNSFRTSDEVRQVLATVFDREDIDLVGYAPRWDFRAGSDQFGRLNR